jgi:hypothetical protein
LQTAWFAAETLLDWDGELRGDLDEAAARFLRRKGCRGRPREECLAAFHNAVEIAQATRRFWRSSCGHNPPRPARRYELLLSLARSLESAFPAADDFFFMHACRLVEMRWDL